MMLRCGRFVATQASKVLNRSLATRRRVKTEIAPQVLNNLLTFDEVDATPSSSDPAVYIRSPVSSAYCIDLDKKQLSALDSVAISPSGKVVHGMFGELPDAALSIPLEYLALLRPAAEGAAALRAIDKGNHGTLLIYGAGEASGLAAAQMASAKGHAVVAVVGAEQSGNDTMVECIKGLVKEPGTAVPEEYALSKANFKNLVHSISSGDEGIEKVSAEVYLQDFKFNLLDYVQTYPASRPAAVSQEHLEFKYMEKDREFFETNMEAYLSQYPPGSPPIDQAKLDAFFSTEQYEIFRKKFWKQTTGVISGDETPFSPPHLVKQQIEAPESMSHQTFPGVGQDMPYSFSILNSSFPSGAQQKAGGPIMGAIIVATPNLKAAWDKVSVAKTLRAKGEAMQFLTNSQRAAFTSANSVAQQAQAAGAPVVIAGDGSIKVTDADVTEAIAAMDIDESGESRLNYFVQVYRAVDYPFYAEYAIHRASEELAGPRQIIVTK
ncbi:hypothetical protein MPSEU_000484400 [Mayamaea pseudoterrestris]|nr:hypothetical protein MPSEU_000484400 [Mayamaea pseudoterrestris]